MTASVVADIDAALHKREVNRLMREGLRALDRAQPIAFFCECGSTVCSRPVWLSGGAYDERKADPAWVALAPGHRPVDPRLARERGVGERRRP